jgi:prepilin-type N-terminal cleavage/methylation domain-containing protein
MGKAAMRKTNKREKGFSLIEAMIAVAIMLTVAAFAMVQSFGSIENYRVNAAMDIVVSQLRVARQLAISQRRYVTITITTSTSPQTITYQIVSDTGQSLNVADTYQYPAVTIPIPPQVNFTQITGVPDTPMQFGQCSGSGVCVNSVAGGVTGMRYTPTGQFTDSSGVTTINGTIFLALPTQSNTARAVTILGSTGRVRQYTWTNNASSGWVE